MSVIPQRKKSPEELAALRAQELAHHPLAQTQVEAPPAAAPEAIAPQPHAPPQKHGVFHDVTGHTLGGVTHEPLSNEVRLPSPAPARSARRGPPEKHGTVHAFDGLRPEAATETFHGQQAPAAPLPQRKHDSRELQEMRHRGLLQTRPPVQHILNQGLHPFLSGLLYLFAGMAIFFSIRHWSYEGTTRFYSPGSGCTLLLLISLVIYLKKPRARHHAAVLSGIALLILGFVILLTLKNPYAP